MPGICGLLEGIKFINNEGINTIYEKNFYLRSHLLEELHNINNVILYDDINKADSYTSCLSLNVKDMDTSELSYILDNDYNIKNRSGLHCAPLAHKTVGTYPSGTVRLSISYFNTLEEINYVINSINNIIKLK